MSALPDFQPYTLDEVAGRVSELMLRRLASKDKRQSGVEISALLQVVFLTREEVAELLRVKVGTIDKWLKESAIPVRYANGQAKSEPRFLLPEILAWTLPTDDPHSGYRLAAAAVGRIAARNRLTAVEG